MTLVVLNDQEILDKTIQKEDNGYLKFAFTTPGKGGREITSSSMPKDAVNAKVLIDWCDAIRGQMKVDYEKPAAEKEKKRQERIRKEDEEKAKLLDSVPEDQLNKAVLLPEDFAEPGSAAAIPVTLSHLWGQYGQALGEVKRIEAQLRAAGESI